jgi:hypothetical protein
LFKKKKSSSAGGAKTKDRKKSVSYLDASRRKRRKYLMIIIPIIAAVVAIGVLSASRYSSEVNKYGTVGSAHEHAAFIINVNGTPIDFGQDRYQLQSRLIHVEGGDGFTLHRHTDKVPFGEFLRSVHMGIDNNCFSVAEGVNGQPGQQQGQGQEYCSNDQNKLRVFVNRNQLGAPSAINDYILNDDDRILVLYGNQTADQLGKELDALQQVPIRKT